MKTFAIILAFSFSVNCMAYLSSGGAAGMTGVTGASGTNGTSDSTGASGQTGPTGPSCFGGTCAGTTTLSGPITLSNTLTSSGNAPTAVVDAGGNAGSGGTCTMTANSTNLRGGFTLTEGASGWSAASQCVITFNGAPLASVPFCAVAFVNSNGSAFMTAVKPSFINTASAIPIVFGSADTGAHSYTWNYWCPL